MQKQSAKFAIRRCLALSLASLLLMGLLAAGQDEPKPKVSETPLTAEQLAVYRSVLRGWMENELSTINLAIQTVPLPTGGAFDTTECGKGLKLEADLPDAVHRFRPQDLAQLGSAKIVLVDPERQRREVHENDPEKTVGEGRSIEDAVSNGFAHGLITLSEIRFDKEHKHAIVSYSFFCGSLCGNGGGATLEKVNGEWKLKSRCHEWIS